MLTLWFATGILAKPETETETPALFDDADGVISAPRKSYDNKQRTDEWRNTERERRQAVEEAWGRVFSEPSAAAEPEQPTKKQRKRLVELAFNQLDLAGIEASIDELQRLVEVYAAERKRKKQNREAMIVLLLAS